MKKYIGIDLGGTNVRVALVNDKGEILEEIKRVSQSDLGPVKVLDNILDMVSALKGKEEAVAVGVGIPGPVDQEKGCITIATNLKDFAYFPVVEYLSQRLNLPVYMDNDANVAGLAEALVGSGKGEQVVYYITHSTGIGGALVVNGRVVSGRYGYAGEVANIIVERNRPKLNHLNAGAVENWASGTAIVMQGKERISEEINSAQHVFELAQEGNEIAEEIINNMIEDFAIMLSTISHTCDPFVYVIGGGVSKSHALYLDKVIARYKELVHPGMRDTKFKLASLDEPGVIGAAMLCYMNQEI